MAKQRWHVSRNTCRSRELKCPRQALKEIRYPPRSPTDGRALGTILPPTISNQTSKFDLASTLSSDDMPSGPQVTAWIRRRLAACIGLSPDFWFCSTLSFSSELH